MPTIFMTGGHSGLGLECSKELASVYHLNLVLAGRSLERIEPVAQKLRSTYGIKVNTLQLDTSSLDSVRSAVAQFNTMIDSGEIDSLQGIICNAGVRVGGRPTYTKDGYEETFATNYLGHFLLVELLVEQVSKDGRIVFTTSGTHDPDTSDGKMMGVSEPDAIMLSHTGKEGIKALSGGKRYTTSKLCMMLHTYELDRRLRQSKSSIASIAYDPGATSGTGFLREMPMPVQWIANGPLMHWIEKRMGITIGSVDFSGKALAKVAADSAYANSSGKYFQSNDGKLIERSSSKLSYDQRRALKLWNDSKKLVHLEEWEEPNLLR